MGQSSRVLQTVSQAATQAPFDEKAPLFEKSIVSQDRNGLTILFEANWIHPLKPDTSIKVALLDAEQAISRWTGGVNQQSMTIDLPVAAMPRLSIAGSSYDEVNLDVNLPGLEDLLPSISIVSANGLGISRKVAKVNVVAQFLRTNGSNKIRRYNSISIRVDYNRSVDPIFRSLKAVAGERRLDSALSDGRWIKIPIAKEGIYRITGEYLNSISSDLAGLDPRMFEIYGNGGAPLPARNEDSRPFDLIRNQTLLIGGDDGSLDAGDALYFYAEGPAGWEFTEGEWQHYINKFSTKNYYFLKVQGGAGDPISLQSPGPSLSFETYRSFESHVFAEIDNELIPQDGFGSGLDWMGALVDETISSRNIMALGNDGLVGDSIHFEVRAAIQSNPATNLNFIYGGQVVNSLRTGTAGPGTATGYVARIGNTSFSVARDGSGLSLEMSLASTSSGQRAWIDYVRASTERQLLAQGDLLRFNTTVEQHGPTAMLMTGFSGMPLVWDISEIGAYESLGVSDGGGGEWRIEFDSSDETRPREFIAFLPSSAIDPEEAGVEIENQNLRSISQFPELVIIHPSEFADPAQRLAMRRESQGMRVLLTDIQEIYNEFSGGLPDMRAVRDYLKFLYDRADAGPDLLRYALLFGDGHFDFRNITEGDVELNQNWIFPYQTNESMLERLTYTSDDYFGLLDENEGEWRWSGEAQASNERVDLGIGRLPVQTISEARLIVDKIEQYEDASTHGAWRTRYTFVADDGPAGSRNDFDLHTQNADVVAVDVAERFPEINQNKVYAISYPTIITSSGRRIPDAKSDIVRAIEDGTLIWNYSGHGGIEDLADERIFTLEDIGELSNEDRLTIFVTATCTFGRFDTNRSQSGAEQLLLSENGGSIAMFTTVRVVVTSQSTTQYNLGLNLELNQHLLGRDENGRPYRLGDVMLLTKNSNVGAQGNNRKFNLLGDPSMRVGLPDLQAKLSSFNSRSADVGGLQMSALDLTNIEGEVIKPDGNVDTSFNGEMQIEVFDSARRVAIPEDSRRFYSQGYYSVQKDLIYRGGVLVNQGKFNVQFVVPKDIGYTNQAGRISMYASSENSDAGGVFDNFIVGGTSDSPIVDNEGPEIELFLGDSTFVSGGIVSGQADLIVKMKDRSGINTVGTGVGHEMLLVLDGNESSAIDIGERFQGELGSFERGQVLFKLPDQELGEHTLSVKVWDVANNSSEDFLDYVIVGDEKPKFGNVFSYPNPSLGGYTRFLFEHNQAPGTPAEVRLLLYSINGRLIKVIDEFDSLPTGALVGGYNQIPWDGLDDDGDPLGNGVYLYKLELTIERDGERQTVDRIERLALIR